MRCVCLRQSSAVSVEPSVDKTSASLEVDPELFAAAEVELSEAELQAQVEVTLEESDTVMLFSLPSLRVLQVCVGRRDIQAALAPHAAQRFCLKCSKRTLCYLCQYPYRRIASNHPYTFIAVRRPAVLAAPKRSFPHQLRFAVMLCLVFHASRSFNRYVKCGFIPPDLRAFVFCRTLKNLRA